MDIQFLITLVATCILGFALLGLVARAMKSDTRIEMPAGTGPLHEDPIENALLSGRKIEAIKLYREQHNVGLREAKDAVERMEREIRHA